jgi:hypothetical protein
MILKLIYYLLFYKIYKVTSIFREKEHASFVAGVLTGIIIVFFIINLLFYFKILILPSKYILACFILSILINLIFIMKNNNYEKIILELNTSKVNITYHIIVYLVLFWGCFGFLFF